LNIKQQNLEKFIANEVSTTNKAKPEAAASVS
jgi:hypothetical protein